MRAPGVNQVIQEWGGFHGVSMGFHWFIPTNVVNWVIKYYWMLNIAIAINSPTTIIGIIWDFMGYDGNLGQDQIISNYRGNWI